MQAWGGYPQGGGLTDHWITAQRGLQLQILARMRSFGMTPVLAGWSGHVPNALKRIYPNASFIASADWGGFNATYSDVLLLQPSDPLFVTLGSTFNSMMLADFGDPTGAEKPMLNMDQWNEVRRGIAAASAATACASLETLHVRPLCYAALGRPLVVQRRVSERVQRRNVRRDGRRGPAGHVGHAGAAAEEVSGRGDMCAPNASCAPTHPV